MFREAAAVVLEGIATSEEVDAVVRGSFGFRLPFFGPFAVADMAGLDVYAGAYAALEKEFGPRFAVPDSICDLIDEGRLGTKTLAGFSSYTEHDRSLIDAYRDSSLSNWRD